jgi:hypothetical protein
MMAAWINCSSHTWPSTHSAAAAGVTRHRFTVTSCRQHGAKSRSRAGYEL